MTVEEFFSTGPPFERPVFEAVMAHRLVQHLDAEGDPPCSFDPGTMVGWRMR